jgi:small-conductance mechanosensitive channel
MYWIEGAYSVGFLLMMIWIGYKVFQGVLLQVGHAIAKRTTAEVDKTLVPAIQKIGTVAIAFIAFSAILGYLQIDLTLFVAGGVVISMVIAFAAQDTLSNFFSGLFLILEPKFKEGDLIYFEGDTFEVKKIGMRTTQLYDLYKHIEVVMPNNKLANEKLINITEPDRRIKDSVEIGVAYGTDPQKVQDILMEIVIKHPDIITDDPDRTPFTRFSEFADSSLNFKIGFWVRDLDDRFRVKSEINQQLYYRLAKENIEIPFPQRDVHLYEHKVDN